MRLKITSDAAEDYFDAEESLRQALAGQGGDCTWYCNSFNPYPMVLSVKELEHQLRLQECVYRAAEKIARNYLDDKRLQDALSLPASAMAILKTVRDLPYKVGSYRLDFLHDTAGGIKLCEINARFPTNGYFISHYINNVVPSLHYLGKAIHRLSPLDDIPSVFIERFKPGSQVSILKEREHNWDIVFLKHELTKRNYSWKQQRLAELTMASEIDGLVIELHQDELLREDSAIVSKLCLQKPHFNDLRTILLAHDKRLLAIFHDDKIMGSYLTKEDSEFLKQNVVETHLLTGTKNNKVAASRNKNEWVLKPNLLGKGEGILFGHSVSEGSWRAALEDPSHKDYVLQRFIKQRKFQVCTRGRVGKEIMLRRNMNVVGTLLCFDDQFLGPGIYRASESDIVNVASGGTILFPMVEADDGGEAK